MSDLAIPAEIKYSVDHEWVKVDGNSATIGITAFAQDQLGDIVYVELPPIGKEFKVKDEFGVVESVKSVSSLFCPVAGKVTAINEGLNGSPELVNASPYEKAWMIKVEIANPAELAGLLSAEEYKKLTEGK
ncbi:glycine cleavage system protein H [candidate division WOR-1 bacterium RIFOXYB2_FULL_42_35]|uniref:Glycine cleavage system H protein n=1 Tax=candidate division WOR-1 bacterium RIFOXYC2_FULL_41_25 TaxID=1802586 RepID=A0A1F4TJ93_UNCSA|nr:MAG: glycine cleavage system protein H [candidate division WOR-1 bacterium RIFOXYA2_FULL_41_14]OGC21952.1 MAG: glycine cleavage system protein H [candidate division WOR-1 bacterium RIFOXYB2_FULL_42_35]OGC32785.1 MAG: glycine cleavage system protein H [candidate division WOR-1 bacterium RIFOXYC2_FULL_41_25]OGC41343.1 MAG: glycine cleavage system protein H [candidate division WOR-1 bacterium RIFOXYD2_FULL_41_8]